MTSSVALLLVMARVPATVLIRVAKVPMFPLVEARVTVVAVMDDASASDTDVNDGAVALYRTDLEALKAIANVGTGHEIWLTTHRPIWAAITDIENAAKIVSVYLSFRKSWGVDTRWSLVARWTRELRMSEKLIGRMSRLHTFRRPVGSHPRCVLLERSWRNSIAVLSLSSATLRRQVTQ